MIIPVDISVVTLPGTQRWSPRPPSGRPRLSSPPQPRSPWLSPPGQPRPRQPSLAGAAQAVEHLFCRKTPGQFRACYGWGRDSHFNPLHLDPPGGGGLVQNPLNLYLLKYLRQNVCWCNHLQITDKIEILSTYKLHKAQRFSEASNGLKWNSTRFQW